MRFQDIALAGLAHHLPDEVLTSARIEERLAPLYARLSLSPGRLELLSGIRERRAWPRGTRPSSVAARAGALAIERSGLARERIGVLVHASVCRDFLEPATASVVHQALGLAPRCQAFDLSNACLGFANALVVVAGMVERGEVEAGLVVAGEDGGPLVEATIARLLAAGPDARSELKRAFASLTIGAGAAACVVTRGELAPTAPKLVGGASLAATEHVELCSGDFTAGADGPLMATDSEALLRAGCELARRTWLEFEREVGWSRGDVDRIVTHQVGSAHRRLLFESLVLDPGRDFPTFPTLGNMGSVSLPATLALAREAGFVRPGDRTALLGIGSGLQCLMLAIR
ncbi:MAG: 3-oxoacyl-ACP synthase III [Planctomycetota bacterium]|nr:3-oxoacyl-ACP synthase III [Planctomycetota bacterium]